MDNRARSLFRGPVQFYGFEAVRRLRPGRSERLPGNRPGRLRAAHSSKAISSALCRSLLAGDSESTPTDLILRRLQAGSYIPNSSRRKEPNRLRGLSSPAVRPPNQARAAAIFEWIRIHANDRIHQLEKIDQRSARAAWLRAAEI